MRLFQPYTPKHRLAMMALRRQTAATQKYTSALATIRQTRPVPARRTLVQRFDPPIYAQTMSTQPKVFPTVGFETLPVEKPIEEENLPNYKARAVLPCSHRSSPEGQVPDCGQTGLRWRIDRLGMSRPRVRMYQVNNSEPVRARELRCLQGRRAIDDQDLHHWRTWH